MKKIKIETMEIYTMTAAEFAALNDIEVNEIKFYSDAVTGAEDLNPDTELEIIVENGEVWATRSDNPWNEPVEVLVGPAKYWTYEKKESMKTLSDWKEEMMEEVPGTVHISCIMDSVPFHQNVKRFQVYNDEGSFNQTFDITLDEEQNITNIE